MKTPFSMRFECKYCYRNMTHYVLMQLEGKLTKTEVENMCDCKKKKKDISKLKYNGNKN